MKFREIQKLNDGEKEKKLSELKMELIKARSGKQGDSKAKQIRKIIARIHTSNKLGSEQIQAASSKKSRTRGANKK